jgi:hypothetical protein
MSVEATRAEDRARGPRRRASDVPAESDPVAEFKAFLDSRLQALEQAAAIAAGEIEVEGDRIRGLLPADDERVAGLGGEIARATATAAEEFARLRGEINGTTSDADGPSEGMKLIVRQMAIAGAAPSEIERRLAHLGIEHSRGAIHRILGAERP